MAKPRVLISSDIGGADPDDIQSMVHAFLYADKINLVGLVSTPSKHGGRTSHINQVIDAYAKDYAKLKTWSNDYPSPEYLKSITKQGSINVAPSQGWSSPTEGSKQIIAAAKAASPSDPVWVLVWGSMTDLAQALHDDPSIKSNIKVYSIGSWNTQQDPAARNYVYNNHKDLWWIENNSTFRGMYVDDNGNGNNSWKMGDAQGHGALGDHFYKAMPWGLKMGDTPSLLYLLDQADNNNPSADSWGGSFVKTGHGPNYWTDNSAAHLRNGGYNGSETVQKHQAAFYQDFAQRLDRAKAAKSGSTPTDPAPTDPPPSGGGTGHPVIAGDDNYKVGVNQSHWFNTKYLLLNDVGKDGGLKVTAIQSKSAAGGTVTLSSDGTVKYTPVKDWQGKDSIEYTVVDKDGSKDTGTIYIQVGTGTSTPKPTDPAPTNPPSGGGTGHPVIAGDDNYKIDVNQSHWFNTKYVLLNDVGKDGGLHVTNVASKSASGGSVSWSSDGTVKYTPLKDWQGKDSIEYTVMDKDGSFDTGTVYIQVGTGTSTPKPTDPAPTNPPSGGGTGHPVIAGDDNYKIDVNQSHWFNTKYVLLNDVGKDGGLHVTNVASKSASGGSVSWSSDGTVKYTPLKDWQGKDSIEYTVMDKDGSFDTGTVYIQVGNGTATPNPTEPTPGTGTGHPVIVADDFHKAVAGKAYYFNSKYLLMNDVGKDGGLKVAAIDATTVKGGSVSWDATSGTAIYKAPAGFTGKDAVEYTVTDRDGSSDTGLVHFDVLLA